MSNIPKELKYTKSHEWIRTEEDGSVTIGITDHAQETLGDLVYVEVPETGSQVQSGEGCAVVESVKAASDVYSPLSGEVIAVNEALADTPEKANQSPYDEGWLMRVKPANPDAMEAFLDAAAYQKLVEEDEA